MDDNFTFDPLTHTYYLDGKPLISVTQLLKKHGLAPDYSGVDEKTLADKAARGTLIHREIEQYLKNGDIGFSGELAHFIEWYSQQNFRIVASELSVHNDIVAGTIDLAGEDKDGIYTFFDYKSSASLHVEAVSWQLSIYIYISSAGKLLSDPTTTARVLHFPDESTMRVVPIPLQPVEEIERLLDCERRGEIFTRNVEGIVTDAQIAQIAEFEKLIAELDARKKEAVANLDGMKTAIMEEMVRRGLKSFETDKIKLTYVLPSEKTTIDTTRLKAERPEIAKEYSKTTTTAASLRITVRKEKQ